MPVKILKLLFLVVTYSKGDRNSFANSGEAMPEYITIGPWRYTEIYLHPNLPGLTIEGNNTNNSFFERHGNLMTSYTAELPPPSDTQLWNGCAKFVEIPKTGTRTVTKALRAKLSGDSPNEFFGHMYGRHFPAHLHKELKTFVRNPYDRLVSSYFFMKRGGFGKNPKYLELGKQYPKFEDFVLGFLDHSHTRFGSISEEFASRWRAAPWREIFVAQKEWLVDDGGAMLVSPENMARFENFQEDLAKVFGVTSSARLNTSSERGPYQEYFARNDVREKVQELYGPDFEALGYDYAL